jgi:hypothetical protein
MPPEEIQEALAKFGWGVQIGSRPPDQSLIKIDDFLGLPMTADHSGITMSRAMLPSRVAPMIGGDSLMGKTYRPLSVARLRTSSSRLAMSFLTRALGSGLSIGKCKDPSVLL